MHKITNLWKFDSIGHRSCKRIMKEKTPLLHKFVCFQMPIKGFRVWSLLNIWVRNYLFLKNYITSEGAVSHNVLYYQQLSIARYKVSFSAYNYLRLPMVSSAFKLNTNMCLNWFELYSLHSVFVCGQHQTFRSIPAKPTTLFYLSHSQWFTASVPTTNRLCSRHFH